MTELSSAAVPLPGEWVRREVLGLRVDFSRLLHFTAIVTQDSAPVGFLLGFPIFDGEFRISEDPIVLEHLSTRSEAKSFLRRVAGRYLSVLLVRDTPTVFTDPFGSLGIVYSREHRAVASTTRVIRNVFAHDAPSKFAHLPGIAELPQTKSLYPITATPLDGVRRLVANHCLILSTFSTARYWPIGEDLEGELSAADSVRTWGDCIEESVLAINAKAKLSIALTAGNDSRAVLACARPIRENLQCFTFRISDGRADLDCLISRKVARLAGVAHVEIPPQSNRHSLANWDETTGLEAGEPGGRLASGNYALMPRDHFEVTGHLGGISRAPYWKSGRPEHCRATVDRLMEVSFCPDSHIVREVLENWLQAAPSLDDSQLLDLFCVEHRQSGWLGVIPYGDAGHMRGKIVAMNHRDIFDAILRVSRDYAQKGTLCRDLVVHRWPELSVVPTNKWFGVRKQVRASKSLAKRAFSLLSSPSRIPDVIRARLPWTRK